MRLPEDNDTKQTMYFKLLMRRRVQAGIMWLALVHSIGSPFVTLVTCAETQSESERLHCASNRPGTNSFQSNITRRPIETHPAMWTDNRTAQSDSWY